jgi:adsorption protein B
VGCAVSRAALRSLADGAADHHPFSEESLTEDYELGLTVADMGGMCRFIRARGEDGRLIATRAYFPARLPHVVRQKTRWLHGIALQGWDRTGWSKGWAEGWMRARDRKGPLTALVLLVGYVLIALTAVGWGAQALGSGEALTLTPLLTYLLYANLAAFVWRAVMRFAFTARDYGIAEGVMAIARIPVTNVIAIMAGRRAVFAYARTLLGTAPLWEKTPHKPQPIHPDALPAGAA